MRDSDQRVLKVACVEIPIPRNRIENETGFMIAHTPPLQLLTLAAAAEEANCDVEYIPSEVWWPPQFSALDPAIYLVGAERILSHRPDLIVTVVNGFSWPFAGKLLTSLTQTYGDDCPRVVVGGIPSTECLQAISKNVFADALFCAGEEVGFKEFLRELSRPLPADESSDSRCEAVINQPALSSITQLSKWPRWEKGLATTETYGFMVENQPHPWNLPATSPPTLLETAEWLNKVTPFLRILREPLLWLSMTSDSWGKDAMELIGEVALTALKDGVCPIFGIRATASEILAPSVLSSLAMLQVRRIDLLVGSGTDSSLQRYRAQYTTQQIEQGVKEIKRAGLASKTRLQSVVGMPGEDLNEALETVRLTARLAAENGIAEVKFESWCNVPDSPFYISTPEWEKAIYDHVGVWFLDEDLLNKAPSVMSIENRTTLIETLELLRILYGNLRIVGPLS